MKFEHVLTSWYGQPWALLPSKFAEIDAVLVRRLRTGNGPTPEEYAGPRPTGPAPGGAPYQRAGDVAVITIMGVLNQRASIFASFSGGTSAEQVGQAVDAAAADSSVRAIVLDVDSPGGSVFGIQEAATKIANAGRSKKVVAVANSVTASAAYWLASQATEIVVTPSGQVGSIGVIAGHTDESRSDEMKGVRTTLITAGKYKAELDPSLPLSAEARASVQSSVDKYYAMFVDAVARGRRTSVAAVKAGYGEGRMLLAKDAVAAGMADRTATLEQVIRDLQGGAGGRVGGGYGGPSGGPVGAAMAATASARFNREVIARCAELGL